MLGLFSNIKKMMVAHAILATALCHVSEKTVPFHRCHIYEKKGNEQLDKKTIYVIFHP
jgi:hypothetical protein